MAVLKRKFLKFVGYEPDRYEDRIYTGTPDKDSTTDAWPIGKGFSSVDCASTALGFASSSALADALNMSVYYGSYSLFTATNVHKAFVATNNKLWQLTHTSTAGAATWSDISRTAGGAYAATDFWEFCEFGNNLIACNLQDSVQTLGIAAGSHFAALGGAPPKASHCAVVRDFVVLGDVNDGTAYRQRVHWSGQNNAATWTVNATTQCDFQDLVGDGGVVQRIVGGEYGTVFQERAIWKMTYVGSPVIFQFDKITGLPGTPFPRSVIAYENMIWWLAHEGFCMLTGGAFKNIGEGRVNRIAWGLTNSISNAQACIAPAHKLVLWVLGGGGSNTSNEALAYNWAMDQWTKLTVATFANGNVYGPVDWYNRSVMTGGDYQTTPLLYSNSNATLPLKTNKGKQFLFMGVGGHLQSMHASADHAAGRLCTDRFSFEGDRTDITELQILADDSGNTTGGAFSSSIVLYKNQNEDTISRFTATQAPMGTIQHARVNASEIKLIVRAMGGSTSTQSHYANAIGVFVTVGDGSHGR